MHDELVICASGLRHCLIGTLAEGVLGVVPRRRFRGAVTHDLRAISNASHELLTTILIGGGVSAAVLLGIGAFLSWRDRKRRGHQDRSRMQKRRSRSHRSHAAQRNVNAAMRQRMRPE
ncbi:MAG: hypothetical protein JNJ42_08570 [Burkholderiaceae bacterium]|nr:hypothetical protein [Burkholderiaceae bacterium]